MEEVENSNSSKDQVINLSKGRTVFVILKVVLHTPQTFLAFSPHDHYMYAIYFKGNPHL